MSQRSPFAPPTHSPWVWKPTRVVFMHPETPAFAGFIARGALAFGSKEAFERRAAEIYNTGWVKPSSE